MRRHHHRAASRQHAVAVQIGACRARQHDPRPIVAGEHQGPLQRARRQHQLARPHLPQTLARARGIGFGEVVGQPLRQAHHVVRIAAERRRARQQRHARMPRQCGERGVEPSLCRRAVDRRRRLGQQRTAQLRLLVAQDDPRTSFRLHQGGGEAGRAGTHHQHVAMSVALRVTIRIGQRRRAAHAGGGADHRLVDAAPRPARPFERLVVESRGQQRRQKIVDGAEIEAERRVMVLALGAQPVIQFELRAAQVRRPPRIVADHRDQRRRLVRAGCQHPARAMIFVRAPDQMHAVRQQGRGERVAGEPLIGPAVETESQRARAIDAPAGRGAERAHGGASPAL